MGKPAQILAAALAVLSVGVAGCGSDDVASTSATTPEVDVSILDVGAYSTEPRQFGKPNLGRARVTEGQRLGSYVPLPMEIDPRFKFQSGSDTSAILGFIESTYSVGLSSNNFHDAAPGFIAGFSSTAQSERDIGISTGIENSVLLFADEQSAAAAATAMARSRAAETEGAEALSLPDRPDAQVFWKPGVQRVTALTPMGRLVVYTRIEDRAKIEVRTTDLPALVTLLAKALDTTELRLREFRPTPSDKLTEISLDHDGMLGRSLPRPNEDAWRNPPGLYDRRGALHLSNDPEADTRLFDEAGVDWLANYSGHVYRAADPGSARLVRDRHSALGKVYRRADAPKNLPEARCRELRVRNLFVPRFHCVVSYDRYAAEMWSDQLVDVHQRISAQYAILTKAK